MIPKIETETPNEAAKILAAHLSKCISEIISGKMKAMVIYTDNDTVKFREATTTDSKNFKTIQ